MMKWNERKLWACILAYAAIVLVLSRISAWGAFRDPAPYRVLLEMLTVFVWMVGIYRCWSGCWCSGDGEAWAAMLVLSTFPHVPLSLIGYGSWVCLGGSVVIGIGMYICKKKRG